MPKVETICPNCGSHLFSKKWISKSVDNVKVIDLDTFVQNAIEEQVVEKQHKLYGSIGGTLDVGTDFFTGTINTRTKDQILADYVQLLISCDKCGFTRVVDINAVRVASEL